MKVVQLMFITDASKESKESFFKRFNRLVVVSTVASPPRRV